MMKFMGGDSGHYKPGVDNLYDAAMILHYNGIELRTFVVDGGKTETDAKTGGGSLLR